MNELVAPPEVSPMTYPVAQVHDEMAVDDPLAVEQAERPATKVRVVVEVAVG
jgi:hypothetical protein